MLLDSAHFVSTSLREIFNEIWRDRILFQGCRSHFVYTVAFARSACTKDQMDKLNPLISGWNHAPYFAANDRMLFPSLDCEDRPSNAPFGNAERRNAHSMLIAVRGVIELFKAFGLQKRVDRAIPTSFHLTPPRRERIHRHQATGGDYRICFDRHEIQILDFTGERRKIKRTADRFTKTMIRL